MRELLLDRLAEVAQGRETEPVHVEQEIVEVQPLGPVRRTGGMNRPAVGVEERAVPREGLAVMLVLGSVERAAGGPHERRVEVCDRVVHGRVRFELGLDRGLGDLSPEVGMDGTRRVLELLDRAAGDVLDDRL